MDCSRIWMGLCGVFALCGGIAAPLQVAAAPSDVFSMSLEELVQVEVGSLFVEDELSVGSVVSKVTEAQWRSQGAEKTFDALIHLPGVYVSDYFHGQTIPSFRGFSGSEQYNSFLLLLDGIPMNNYSSAAGTYGAPNYALGNLESIEVIRGPGSSIYGADAFNGVVSLNTWSSDIDQVEAWAEAGDFGYLQGNARLRHSWGDDVVLTSVLSASGTENEHIPASFHSSATGALVDAEITGEYENLTTTHKLAIRNFEFALYYSEHETADSFGSGELAPVFPNGGHTDGAAKMMALKISHVLELDSGMELETSVYDVQDELYGRFGIGANVGVAPTDPAFVWDSEDHRTGLNLTLRRPLSETGSRFVFGYSYDEVEVDHLGVSMPGFGAPYSAMNVERRLHGVMGQVEQRFMEDMVQVIAGVRHDDYSDFGGHTSPRLAVIFHPTEQSALKFLYGNAYRAPSINEQADNGLVKGGGTGLEPEQVDTYEIAWIQSHEKWRYRVSTYSSEVEDSIALGATDDPSFVIQYENGVSAESVGVELEAVYQSDSWQLYANTSWNESEQTLPVPETDSYSSYPDLIVNAGASYSPAREWFFSLNNVVYDGFETVYPGVEISPSYQTLGELPTLWRTDFHVRWAPKSEGLDYQLYLTVLDLFDRQDTAASMVPVEGGAGTPGRKVSVGMSVAF